MLLIDTWGERDLNEGSRVGEREKLRPPGAPKLVW